MIEHLDLRAEGPPLDVQRTRYRFRNGSVAVRDPATVTGIVVHQTACTFGGDAPHRRALRIPAHATAFRDGTFVTPCPLAWYAHHGNGLNDRSLGLEIEGRYAGRRDDPATAPREDLGSTWGGPPDVLTPLAIECARAALAWLVEAGRADGMPIRYVWAHRQSSATRRSDPGEDIWRSVVMGGTYALLGLEVQPALVVGDGRPIPTAWDARGVGRY